MNEYKITPEDSDLQKCALEAEGRRLSAITTGDVETLEAMIAESALCIHSSGEIDTKKEYLAKLSTRQFRYAAITTERHYTTFLGSAVALTYRMQADVVFPTFRRQTHTWTTAIWQPTDDTILVKLFQSTSIPLEQ